MQIQKLQTPTLFESPMDQHNHYGDYHFLLTKMEQGASLIIDMLDNPLQTSMVIFWMYVLYTILSHYPVYLFHRYFKASDGQSKPESWSMYTDILKFGITYFDKNKLHQIKGNDALLEYNKNDNNFTPYRKFIGEHFYLSMVYCLLFTYGKYYGQPYHKSHYYTIHTAIVAQNPAQVVVGENK